MNYSKPSFSIDSQISRLQKRGLLFKNVEFAKSKLQFIGYYHLDTYCKSFQDAKDVFNRDTYFEDILDLYVFDRKLKFLAFDAIERIELAIKSLLTNELTENGNEYWFEKESFFVTKRKRKDFNHRRFLNTLDSKMMYLMRKDGVIKEFFDKQPHRKFPPSWILMEALYFSESVELFDKLKGRHKQKISKYFNITDEVLSSWLYHINDIRNICAHHGRLWNRSTKKIMIPKTLPQFPKNGNIFLTFCVFAHFLSVLSPGSEIISHFISLVEGISDDQRKEMNIFGNWKSILLDILKSENE